MTKTQIKFKPVVKDKLFYNQFEYSIGFKLIEANCLRNLSWSNLDYNFQRRIEWRDMAIQRWSKVKTQSMPFGTSHLQYLVDRRNNITDETLKNLQAVANLLLTSDIEHKLVVTTDYGHVYTNDFKLINQLTQLKCLQDQVYTQAVVGLPKNVVVLKNPKHQFRSYIKLTKLTVEQKNQLQDFLAVQPTVRLSPALRSWMDGCFVRTQDWFFIDHNEMSWLTMLALVQPGIIRKTQQIIQAK